LSAFFKIYLPSRRNYIVLDLDVSLMTFKLKALLFSSKRISPREVKKPVGSPYQLGMSERLRC
jgi:hypothetical protein